MYFLQSPKTLEEFNCSLMGFQYPKRYGSSSLYIWFAHFIANFIQASTSLVWEALFEFVVLTDGESDDSHLFSRTRTFHSQIFFSGSTTIGLSYVTRGSAVEFRLVHWSTAKMWLWRWVSPFAISFGTRTSVRRFPEC